MRTCHLLSERNGSTIVIKEHFLSFFFKPARQRGHLSRAGTDCRIIKCLSESRANPSNTQIGVKNLGITSRRYQWNGSVSQNPLRCKHHSIWEENHPGLRITEHKWQVWVLHGGLSQREAVLGGGLQRQPRAQFRDHSGLSGGVLKQRINLHKPICC